MRLLLIILLSAPIFGLGGSEYFVEEEFACKCSSSSIRHIDKELLDILDKARRHFNSPIIITSGIRSVEYNKVVGGRRRSKHLLGIAADIVVKDVEAIKVYKYFNTTYPHKYGIGKHTGYTHIDTRSTRTRW